MAEDMLIKYIALGEGTALLVDTSSEGACKEGAGTRIASEGNTEPPGTLLPPSSSASLGALSPLVSKGCIHYLFPHRVVCPP